MYTLVKTGQAHGLGRTNIIYWPCQFLMTAAAIVLLVRAGLAGQEANHSPASVLASASVATAWVRKHCHVFLAIFFEACQLLILSSNSLSLYVIAGGCTIELF